MRIKGWEKAHKLVIDKHAALPSEYGISDCYIFPDDNVEAITGKKLFGETVRKYKNEIGAAKHLRKRGFENVEQAFASKFEEIPTAMAQRGDIGVILNASGEICGGVFTALGFAAKFDGSGIAYFPHHEVKKAFKVI